MPRSIDPHQSFPALELRVLERWRALSVFEETVRRRQGAPRWIFHEGPPTVNGPPGVHHLLTRAVKDVFIRHRTMRGYLVERKAGWDCHGLPVEIAVERQLGFATKGDIERYGVAEFNARCRELVHRHMDDWEKLTERVGCWIDLAGAYRTLDPGYVDAVWSALRMIWERDLLYERERVLPYCPRCETPLSSHELGQPGVYKDVVDPSVYVCLPVVAPVGPLRGGDDLVVWTTTPWTIVANAAVAIDPEQLYVRVRAGERVLVVAEAALELVLGDGDHEVLDRFRGRALERARYAPPFPFLTSDAFGPRAHTVLPADFVSVTDGSGLMPISVAFGENDFRLGELHGLRIVNPVREDGRYDDRIGPYAGRPVKEAEPEIVEALRRAGRLLREERREHSYPHCWRCATPLLYYAKVGWFIRTTAVRDRLLACNEEITWHPAHVKHGRFGNWLEGNVDWALSRDRYWGTPLPIWRCEHGHSVCLGSLAELEQRSGTRPAHPHRPDVDEARFPCPDCGETMTRVPEVIDVWFDSGAMPFAQHHASPLDRARLEDLVPGDFICEGLDQTRGLFYAMHAVSTLVFDHAPFRNVLCIGLVLDAEGRKMSKSQGNAVDPGDTLELHGADALRWYLYTRQPWDARRFAPEAIGEATRQFLLPLWNIYGFYVMYVNACGPARPGARAAEPARARELDRWILSRLAGTIEAVGEHLDAFDVTSAGRALAQFVEDLSNWYVRRSRRRFWDEEPAAFATLRRCLVTVAHLLAPLCPFVADEIYTNLDGSEASVHLCAFPDAAAPGSRDLELEHAMAVARQAVRLGLLARNRAAVKVRQPLQAAVVVASDAERAAIERMRDVICEELNVKQLRFVDAADQLQAFEVRLNNRSLGPRFGKHLPRVAAAVAAKEPSHVARALRDGRPISISIAGEHHALTSEDVEIAMVAHQGYEVAREGAHAVALELELDEELRQEGLVREVVRAVQAARRAAGLEVSDRIALALGGDETLLAAARAHQDYLAGETLATSVAYDGALDGHPVEIERRPLRVAARQAGGR